MSYLMKLNGSAKYELPDGSIITLSEIEALRAALLYYMSQFGQALEANGIPFGPEQVAADAQARAALAKADGEDYLPENVSEV